MKKHLLATVAAAAFATSLAHAQAPAPTPEHTVTGNMTIATDYRSRHLPDLWGGLLRPRADDPGRHRLLAFVRFLPRQLELEHQRQPVPERLEHRDGLLRRVEALLGRFRPRCRDIYYYYPGGTKLQGVAATGARAYTYVSNWEAYVGGSWKWFSLKYSYSFTNYFGLSQSAINGLCNPNNSACQTPTASGALGIPPLTQGSLPQNGDTKGTQYLFGAFDYEIMPKLTLTATAGYTWVGNYSQLNYFDFKVGATYDLAGWLLSANIIGTDADKQYWYACNQGCASGMKVREIGRTGLVLSVGKTF